MVLFAVEKKVRFLVIQDSMLSDWFEIDEFNWFFAISSKRLLETFAEIATNTNTKTDTTGIIDNNTFERIVECLCVFTDFGALGAFFSLAMHSPPLRLVYLCLIIAILVGYLQYLLP
jgi:hypothetical protein